MRNINITNPKVVEFGRDGRASILIHTGVENNEAYLLLSKLEKDVQITEIQNDVNIDEVNSPIMLKFFDSKSIDVLISQLKKCKRALIDPEGESKHEQWLKDRHEAFLSMDKETILAYERKYNIDREEECDEEVFWIGVHMGRTAILSLPESERRKSMNWLLARGYSHFASDLETKNDK